MLLSRVADNLYWGARYVERAEDTARVVRTYTEVIIDLPTSVTTSWEPLLAIAGSRELYEAGHARVDERSIVRFLVTDTAHAGSIASTVAMARENLRTTREVLPREAWQTVNDLHLYTTSNGESGVDRRSRARFLGRVVADIQLIDGILSSSMTRDEGYELWRLGQVIERADMTTRVLGVRAAALMHHDDVEGGPGASFQHVQWMGVLRSLSALQMYQRATHGPIEPARVVDFLLHDERFPRSVASCVRRAHLALTRLPHADRLVRCAEQVESTIAAIPMSSDDGEALDRAMDRVQLALAGLNDEIVDAFVDGPR